MAIFKGTRINFGVDSTLIGVNGAFQTRDHAARMESKLVKNIHEQTTSKVYWDFREEAVFTYVAIDVGNVDLPARVLTPSIGRFVTVTDFDYAPIVGRWLVDDVEVHSSNTTATRVQVKLSRFPLIRG